MSAAPLPGFLEVEIGTFCNRQCAWCPNGWHDRGLETKSKSLAEPVWQVLLADLGRVHFGGWFAFHNDNEPMADPRLLERMAQAREAMPGARLELHTNGDFLTPTSLRALADVGCSLTRVTLSPSNEKALEPPNEARLHRFLGPTTRRRPRCRPTWSAMSGRPPSRRSGAPGEWTRFAVSSRRPTSRS